MWPWSRIAKLEELVKELNDRLSTFSDYDKAELDFLRDLIKDYAVVKSDGLGFYYVSYHFYAARTLPQAEREIKAKNLYIKVLESELGAEKSKSCQEKFTALVALKCGDDNLKAIGEEHAEG